MHINKVHYLYIIKNNPIFYYDYLVIITYSTIRIDNIILLSPPELPIFIFGSNLEIALVSLTCDLKGKH